MILFDITLYHAGRWCRREKKGWLIMKKVLAKKITTWYDPLVVLPPYNKIVLLSFAGDPNNVYFGYYVNDSCHWRILDNIYTFNDSTLVKKSICFPDSWADLPNNPWCK